MDEWLRGKRGGERDQVAADDRARPEIDEEIFGLGAPVVAERNLDAAAGGIAEASPRDGGGFDRASGVRERILGGRPRHRHAAGDVEQPLVEGEAKPRACRDEPVGAGCGADSEKRAGEPRITDGTGLHAAAQTQRLDIGLDADDPRRPRRLPVVAGLQSDGNLVPLDRLHTRRVHRTLRRPIRKVGAAERGAGLEAK